MHPCKQLLHVGLVLVTSLVFLGLFRTLPGVTHAAVTPTNTLPTVNSGDDFATQELGDPWDMSEPRDIALEFTRSTGKVSNLTFSGGLLQATATEPPRITLMLPSDPNVNPVPHEGRFNPLNATAYKYATVRFYVGTSSAGNAARFLWQAVGNTAYGSSALNYVPNAGWYILTYDLTQAGGGDATVPWSGLIEGLYFDPMMITSGPFAIDFVRLAQTRPSIPVTWSNLEGTLDIYVGTASDGSDKARIAQGVAASSGRYDWEASLAPGTYYVFLQTAGASSAEVLQTLTLPVNATPQITITAPSYLSGPDYATEQLGNSWDMNDATDIAYTSGINTSSISFTNGIFTATSPQQNKTCGTVACGDTLIHLNVGPLIDTSRYKYFSYRMKIDGAQDTYLGSVGRIIWWSTVPEAASISKSWVIYEDWQTVSFDLTQIRLESSSRPAWAASTPKVFRFDPHEFAAPHTFNIDYVTLTGDERANTNFTIRYEASDADGTPRVQFFYDTDAQGFDGQAITCSSAQNPPVKTLEFTTFLPILTRSRPGPTVIDGQQCIWQTANVPAGTYYIYGIITDGTDSVQEYGKVPVIVSH